MISDDNMQIRLLYKNYNMQIFAKVFRFKGFYIKNKEAMGGGWALGNKNCVQTFRGLNKGFTTSDWSLIAFKLKVQVNPRRGKISGERLGPLGRGLNRGFTTLGPNLLGAQ